MKKLLMLLLAGVFIFFCSACGTQPEEENVEGDDTAIENPVDESELESEAGAETETEAETEENAALSQDEADALYTKAADIYAIFDSKPLPTDPSEIIEIDGIDGYEIVSVNRYESLDQNEKLNVYNNLAQLEALLKTVFSEEICTELMDSKIYAEKDGVLYERSSGRGSDITRGKVLSKKLTNVSNDSATYVISVENIDPDTETVNGTQEVSYQLNKINGKWIFATFEPLY